MQPQNINKNLRHLFEKIVVDFDGFYSRKRRILFHAIFWLCLLLIYMADLWIINHEFTFGISFVMSFREIAESIFFFYLVSYFVIPKLFFRGKYIAGIIALSLPFLLAPTIDYLTFTIFYPVLLKDKIAETYINLGLFIRDIHSVFNRQDIILSIMPIILRTMPAFLMKMLVSTIHFFSQAIQQKKKQHELEMENLQLEVNFLKSQMNPHYLFNMLNNIYSYAYLKDDRALDLISDLSEVLSYTLYESKNTFVSLDKELKFLENYLRLEKSRLKDNGAMIEMKIDYLGAERLEIAPLLLFPFVENAIKHGIECNKKSGWLRLTVSVKDGLLLFRLKNSKTKNSALPPHDNGKVLGGVGEAAARRRLDLLYPSTHDISIEKTDNIYSVSLKIKCKENEPEPQLHYS